jgi:hypothetical protein
MPLPFAFGRDGSDQGVRQPLVIPLLILVLDELSDHQS